jgi:hypothetical protein
VSIIEQPLRFCALESLTEVKRLTQLHAFPHISDEGCIGEG